MLYSEGVQELRCSPTYLIAHCRKAPIGRTDILDKVNGQLRELSLGS